MLPLAVLLGTDLPDLLLPFVRHTVVTLPCWEYHHSPQGQVSTPDKYSLGSVNQWQPSTIFTRRILPGLEMLQDPHFVTADRPQVDKIRRGPPELVGRPTPEMAMSLALDMCLLNLAIVA